MEKTVIIKVEQREDGCIFNLNVPSRLKSGYLKSMNFFVSWDKIGDLLFEDYANDLSVSELDEIRKDWQQKNSNSGPA